MPYICPEQSTGQVARWVFGWRNLSPLTVSAYMSALRQFYGWTEVSLFYPNIARSVKAPRIKKGFMKSHLSPKPATALLDYLKGKSLRNYAIVNLI